MNGTLRIALAQVNPTVGDLSGNLGKIADFLERARDEGADIVAFPELAVSGYPPEDLLLKRSFLRDCREAVEEVTQWTSRVGIVLGFPDSDGSRVYNAAALISDRKVLDIYHKLELPNYGIFDEKRYFQPGSKPLVFEMTGVSVAVTICEDLWVEKGETEHQVSQSEASIVVNVSASPFHAGKLARRLEVLTGFARRTRAYVCYVNQVGAQDELVFDGGSLVVDSNGAVLASAKRFEEDLLVVDVNVSPPARSTRHAPSAAVVVVPKGRYREGRQPVAPSRAPELPLLDEIHEALVLGTRDYVRKNGFSKAVIGLSGGIDSSLTAAIAVEALGADNVVGVTMPSQYTSQETRSDAALLAGHLGIALLSVPIQPIFSVYLDSLREPFGPGAAGVETENLQARIRGNILMALSNRHGWLVLTTGNKSETAVGYCTLYGDTAGGFAVIKDVPKTLVYELAERVNAKAGRDVIPQGVIERPPSAELKEDQKDQDSLPPYEDLDAVLERYVERDMAPDEIARDGFDMTLIGNVVRLVDRSEYKRRQAPPGLKITPKAFGRDRRLPITNRYNAGLLKETAVTR